MMTSREVFLQQMQSQLYEYSRGGLKDFSSYPQFSTIKRFIKYKVAKYYAPNYRIKALEAYSKGLEDAVCDICNKKAKYIQLSIAIQHCTSGTLWVHHTFCNRRCYQYFVVVIGLGGKP